MPGGANNNQANEPTEERYERLIALYTELIGEFDKLHHEGVILKDEIHQAIDRAKVQKILASIKNPNSIP